MINELFQTGSVKPEEKNIKAILSKYLCYWYLFLTGGVLSLGLAYFYMRYYTVPQYRISSTLLIKDEEKGSGGSAMESFGGLDIFKTSGKIDNEIEILKSKSLMYRVLDELSLKVKYEIKGRISDIEIYGNNLPIKILIKESESLKYGVPIIIHFQNNNSFTLEEEGADGKKIFSDHKFGQEIRKSYGTFTVVANTGLTSSKIQKPIVFRFLDVRKLADQYSNKLSIDLVTNKGSVLSINLVDAIPQKGKDIVNKLIEVYNEEAIEDKNQLALNTIELIDDRLTNLTTELASVERTVERYKQRNDLTDVSSEAQLYLERASEYNRQSAEYEIRIDVLNSIENYLKKQGKEPGLVPSSLNIQDPTLLALISKFNELQLERQRHLRTTHEIHPLILDIDEQLFNLRTNILENLQNIKNGLIITQKNLQANSQQFESRIQKVPSIERELLEISRQQSIKEGLYLYLLQKREEAALSLAAAVSNSRIIDPVRSTNYPISPNKMPVYLAALMIGMGVPLAGIYIKDFLNDKIQAKNDVEKATATPVLGEIAHKDQKQALVVTEESRSAIAELFRLIRFNLHFAAAGSANKVILVTSTISGEGKTFFCINFGASLALTGKKVAAVSFDLRAPKLMQELKLPNQCGVTNFLVNYDLPLEKIIVPSSEIPGLFLIGSGPIPSNPGELMTSNRVKVLIDELKELFDYILIDSTPIGQVADAFSLAPYIDSCIYLIRYNYTLKEHLRFINDIFLNKKFNRPLIVLNDAKKGNGYSYQYGYGNARKTKEKQFKPISNGKQAILK